MNEDLRYSARHIDYWIKLEIMNNDALLECIVEKTKCQKRKNAVQKSLTSNKALLAKLQGGKISMN